jgi:hypothetical protein
VYIVIVSVVYRLYYTHEAVPHDFVDSCFVLNDSELVFVYMTLDDDVADVLTEPPFNDDVVRLLG